MAGKVRRSPACRDQFGRVRRPRRHRSAPGAALIRRPAGARRRARLPPARASRCSRPAFPRFQQGGCPLQQAVLQSRQWRRCPLPSSARRCPDGGGWCRSPCTAHRPAPRRTARATSRPRRRRRSREASCSRVRFSCRRLTRAGERSTAVTIAPACASCAVLPPGAAQRSATDLPRRSPNSLTGSAAAASCTHHLPSLNPGSIVTAPCSGVRMLPVGSTSPCRRSAQLAASDFTRDVERRLVADRGCDLVRGGLAVVRDPSLQQPGGNIGGLASPPPRPARGLRARSGAAPR